MSKYVSVFVWSMPKRNIATYRRLVKKIGPIFRKLGATEFREYVAADLKKKHGMVPFPLRIKPRKGETLFVSIVGYRSKSHCRQVTKRFEKYPWPNMDKIMNLVDHKRMLYGEFSIIVKA